MSQYVIALLQFQIQICTLADTPPPDSSAYRITQIYSKILLCSVHSAPPTVRCAPAIHLPDHPFGRLSVFLFPFEFLPLSLMRNPKHFQLSDGLQPWPLGPCFFPLHPLFLSRQVSFCFSAESNRNAAPICHF